jgi:hypothetical protein
MTTRQYSSRSQQTTLTGAITAGATSMTVVSGTALLGGVTIPAGRTFTLVIDVDTALEEIVDATAVSTNTFTITRAIDGSSAQEHSAGAVVRHMAIGRDYRDANLHAEAAAAYTDGGGNNHTMHGIATGEGDVVGTAKTQTLTNKTLTSPTISNPTLTGTPSAEASIVFEGTTADAYETTLTVVDPTQDNTITLPNTTGTVVILDATQTLTNKTLTSPTISGSPVITGLSSAGMIASSATPKDYVDAILGSATAAATSAASAATSAASAATSASSASTSASSALTSANSASASATAAATSATSAAASATAAATSATSAAADATTAANSVASIAAYATTASNSASAAATSATSAAASATAAATSATSAAASATAAATSATSAAASATAAATSAASASTSASSALTSANSAAVSAASAAAAVAASFDAKGDLLVGTGAQTFDQLTVAATNGYVLAVNSATATGLEWIASATGDITAVSAGTGISVTDGTGPVPTVAIDSTVATLTGSQTLTNKTVALGSNTVSGTIAQFNTALTDGDFATLAGSETLTNKTVALGSNTVSGTIAQFNTALTDADFATLAGSETLTNKTLTSPTINGAFTNSVNEIIARGFEEDVNVVASAATGTINIDVATASIWYYTSNATANHTLNFRYNSTTSLSSKLAVGDAITIVWMNTNGTTAYYPNTIQIDGTSVTPKVPAAITAGNASAIDAYSFTIIKTAATPTYTVLETQTKFA